MKRVGGYLNDYRIAHIKASSIFNQFAYLFSVFRHVVSLESNFPEKNFNSLWSATTWSLIFDKCIFGLGLARAFE